MKRVKREKQMRYRIIAFDLKTKKSKTMSYRSSKDLPLNKIESEIDKIMEKLG